MTQHIIGFHRDEEAQWVAELACGHTRHVRHNPPWELRPWVLSATGRQSRLGEAVECMECLPGARGAEPAAGT